MKYLVLCLTLLTALSFIGCSHTSELTNNYPLANEMDVNYSVTYYIHADSDYLYHSPDGTPVRGNSEILTTAMEVGKAARSGEVFIYSQRQEKKLLGLFRRKSSRFFHYKNGQLITKIKYRHQNKKELFMATEAQLIHQYRAQEKMNNHKNYFLYFGHEIPSDSNKRYNRSLPHIDVNTISFAHGIQNFLSSDEDRFDLVVLSTCNNGTPEMAESLMPFTDVMLASPQNLHLSHIDSDRMTLLEMEPDTSATQLARLMAEQTFQRLQGTVRTTITLALYDFEKVRDYINSLTSITSTNITTDRTVQYEDNVDCAELFFPDSDSYRKGVETWYKPARFGRKSGQSTHSGWGCKPGVK